MADNGRPQGPIVRVEDAALVSGRGRFLGDVALPGTLAAAFVRSPHAHARVLEVDVSAAIAQRGVVAALSGRDLAHETKPIRVRMTHPGYRPTEWPVLAPSTVRFVGEPVAVVVATDRYLAEDAAEGVVVSYEPLTAVPGIDAALDPRRPRVHEHLVDNVLFRFEGRTGDVDACFANAAVTIEETFRHDRCVAAPMEGRGALAIPEDGGGVTLWSSTQIPHLVRTAVAECLGLPETRVRVITPDVGGGFGVKMHLYPEEVAVAILARRLGRPVKWVEDRRENLLAAAHARDQVVHAAVAADASGKVLAMKATCLCDVGAYSLYPMSASLDAITAAPLIPGPYDIQAYAFEAVAIATNKSPQGAYRGVGWVMATFVRERLLDMLAARLDLDPLEIRRRNIITRVPYTTASGMVIDGGDYHATVDRLAEVSDYETLKKEVGISGHAAWRGIGLCVYAEPTATGSRTYRQRGVVDVPGFDAATIRLDPTGVVHVYVSAVSQGQGHATTFAQVAADCVRVPLEHIRVVQGDTAVCPKGSGTFGSRSLVVSGGALVVAAERLREEILRIAARLLEVSPADLVDTEGGVIVRGSPGSFVSLRQIARAAADEAGSPEGLTATAEYDPSMPTVANGAHLALVEVDPETYQVKLLRHIVVDDCGRIVNRAIVEGQVRGGIAQGIGETLLEAMVYDEDGQPLTASFMDYLVPTAMEIPEIVIEHVETRSPISPTGSRGIGEGGTLGAVGAIANAVANALAPLGVSVRALPLSVVRLFDEVRTGRESARVPRVGADT